MPETKDFFIEAKRRLDILKEQQRENIMKAAQIMGDCMTENGVVQLFGIEHGRMFAMELFYRAGGLMPFHQISTLDLAIRGIVTEKEYQAKEFNDRSELVHHFWEIFQIEPQDMFIFISNTGCEGMMVEAALRAKAEGRSIIAVVSEKQADKASSHHPSGKKLTELADMIYDNYKCEAGDVMIISSNSGRNVLPIEMAMRCQKEGVYVIAVTNLMQSKASESRHPSGRKLYEYADSILDNGVPFGDSLVEIQGMKTGPGSTISSIFLLNTIITETIRQCVEQNIPVPLFQSQNVDGFDNDRIYDKYDGRVKHF